MRLVRLLCALVLSLGISSLAISQNLGTGLYAFGSFDSRGFDTVNIGNLNTHFEIPIVTKQGRGVPFNYSIVYDGLVWSPSNSGGTGYWVPDSSWGFRGDLVGAYTGYLTYDEGVIDCPPQAGISRSIPGLRQARYIYHDSYGRNHALGYSMTSCPSTGTVTIGNGASEDGSGYYYSLTDYMVHSRSGAILNVPVNPSTGQVTSGSITDSNGNKITNNGNGTFTDTLGTTALNITGQGSAASPLSFSYPVTLQADGATTATATISYRTYTVQTNFQCSGISEYGATSVDLTDHITLADGSTYSFTYESTPGVSGAVTGRLASITLPTGGTISYSYTNGCNGPGGAGINGDGTVGSLIRTTSDGTRSYNRAGVVGNSNATSTMVQDESGNQTLYQFSLTNGFIYETHRQVYQGQVGGTPLEELYTCYNGTTPSCDAEAITLPITQIETLNSYNGGAQNEVLNSYSPSGLLTQSNNYDGSGSLLTQQAISYNSNGEVLQSTTEDGSGHAIASTSYGYDETAVTATSGIAQHLAASGTRGNQTSSHIATGSGTIDTATTYYDTGVPVSVKTPNGTTQYGYDTTQTFVTQTTLPTPSSDVQLSTSASYDPQSGALISATGLNPGQTEQHTVYDRLLRPKGTLLPGGGAININYATFNQTGISLHTINDNDPDTETLLDAYGRKSRVAVWNGQPSNPWYQVDYCYNSVGQLQFQSTRYQGNGWSTPQQCSGNGTSYTYDALGRMASKTTTDGTTAYHYIGRAVEVGTIFGTQKITQYDSLGRISGICEISSNANMPGSGSPASCGMDISGTGFVTGYSYDLVNHKTTITQGAQTRVFQTDAAGRTIYTSEPERGVTTYSYAYNGTGLLVTRIRPQANQTNPATTTTTTTQYDSLGRVVAVNYSDNLTPLKNFSYDTVSNCACWPNGSSATNLKGKLAIMGAASSSADLTGTLFSYDLMGNVLTQWQCAPSTCSGDMVSRPLSFSYDLVGNITSLADSASGTIAYGHSSAGEITSITNQTFTDPTSAPNLVSNVVNGPNGPLSYSLGNGLSVNRTYDAAGRLNGGWVCSGSAQPNCAGGGQTYGFTADHLGSRVTAINDTALSQHIDYGYDEFNRLTSSNISNGQQTFNYSYDRYGNRWGQTAPQGGPAPSFSFNAANNQIVGMSYDAAGNLTADGMHSYTYDAEGNVLKVDNGTTALYVYDAMNRRASVKSNGVTEEYVFDFAGRRISTWDPTLDVGIEGRIYWDGQQIAYRAQSGPTFFEHQDWMGTERVRTNYQGQVAATDYSYPFGDGYSENVSITEGGQDNLHYAKLDYDTGSNTDHAQFRQYSNTQGRWMSPDPYDGSYSVGNPQSFNRYSYAMNRPLSATDPQGLTIPDCNDSDWGMPTCSILVTADPDPPVDPGSPGDCFLVCAVIPPQLPPSRPTGPNTPSSNTGTNAPNNVVKHYGVTVPCSSSASQVMGAVESNFAAFGNYSSGPFSLSFGTPPMMGVGAEIPITAGYFGLNQNMGVSVQSMSSSSMSFSTLPGGHLLYPAGITFSASSAGNGAISFNINLAGNFNGLVNGAKYYLGGAAFENAQWNHFLGKVSAYCSLGG